MAVESEFSPGFGDFIAPLDEADLFLTFTRPANVSTLDCSELVALPNDDLYARALSCRSLSDFSVLSVFVEEREDDSNRPCFSIVFLLSICRSSNDSTKILAG